MKAPERGRDSIIEREGEQSSGSETEFNKVVMDEQEKQLEKEPWELIDSEMAASGIRPEDSAEASAMRATLAERDEQVAQLQARL